MSASAIDNSNDVGAALAVLVDHDPAGADRQRLGELMARARKVRAFLDGYDIACARRGRELNAEGRSESAFALFLGNCGSGKEAHATEVREGVCAELPEFEDALAAGDVSNAHLDALGRHTRNLSDEERLDVKDRVDELLGHATNETAELFDKHAKAIITQIKDQYRPDSDAEELERQRRESNVSTWVDKSSGMRKTLIELDPIRHEQWWRAYDAQLARLKAEPGSKDKTFQQLKVAAFLATMEAGGSAPVPRVPRVSVLIDWETLLHGRHAATIAQLIDGTAVPISTIRELLCEAEILPVVLGGAGEVLDVGRSRRLATRSQRDALAAMYETCVEPGCPVPVEQTEVHHIVPWEQGGPTDLANLAPLCAGGHDKLHREGWQLDLHGHDGTATWTRPDGTVSYHGPAPGWRNRRAGDPP